MPNDEFSVPYVLVGTPEDALRNAQKSIDELAKRPYKHYMQDYIEFILRDAVQADKVPYGYYVYARKEFY